MNIATLTIEMAANVARLRQDMDNAASVVQSATAKMQKAAELAGKALGVIGVGLSLSAFTGFIRNAIDAADALDEMSGRVGVSAKELSGLQLAYKQAGMGNEAMASSLAKLSREMSEGNVGLRALGVNTRNADGSLRGTTAVLLDVADKFKGMEDGAAKTALAMEIFGKSGAEMVPLLNSGAEGIAEMTAMAEKLGLVIEDSAAAQAGQFNDTLELLGLGVQGVGTRIAAQLLPTLNSLAGSFLTSMTSGDRLTRMADILAVALKSLYSIGVGVAEAFATVGKGAAGLFGAIAAARRGDFSAAASYLKESWSDITSGWEASGKAISDAWNTEAGAAVAAGAAMVKTNKDLLAAEKAREEAAKKAAAAAAKAAEEAKKKAEDGAKLAASLLAQDSGLAGDFAEKWGKLSAAYAANKISLEDLTLAQKELLEQQPLMKKAQEEAAKASQAAADARHKESDGIAAFMRAQEEAAAAALKSVKDRITSLQDEEQAAELSRSLNISLAEAVERVAIARLQEKQAGFYENSEGWENLRREIEERQKLLGLIARKDVREREERGWTDMWSSVDRTAHDVFVNIFDGGTNVFKKLGQTLKASVLDVLYQMTVRKWIISIGTSVLGSGFGAAANAATGAAGGSVLGSAGTSMLGSMMGGVSSLGIGASYGVQSLFANGLGATLSAGGQMIGAGSVMSGLGTIAGALGPIALGIGAVVALVKKLDDSGTIHTGALSQYSAAGGLANSTTHGAFGMGFGGVDYSAETEKFTGAMAQSIVQMLDSTATTFGKEAGYKAATAFADDTSKDGAWGGLLISKLEETIVNWDPTRTSKWAPREFADGAAGKEQYLAAVAADVRVALNSIGLPAWATSMLDKLGQGATIEQLASTVDLINAAKAAFASFGQYMPTFADLADSAIGKLVDESGGVQAVVGNMATFVELYTTDAEKLAVSTEAVRVALAKLGMDMPATREEYAAQVKANIALGDAGAKTVAGLLAVAGAFASATQAAEEAAQAERERASALRGAFAALADSLADMRSGVAAADARVAAVRMDIWSGYADAQQKVIDLEMQAADATRGFAQSLRGFVSDLATGPNSGMGLDARYQMLQQRFAETAARAGAGDQGARDALTGVASAYLDVARANARSGVEYARDAARVTAQLNKLASAAEADPLVQKYDAQTLTLQQQIADAQIDVVKHLALMEVAGVSTDLGIQTVDKTLQALRDEYVAATQEQAAANLKLDVALAALDALGLTEDLVKAIAANQTNSLSVALGISDEALSSITGALGLTPENVEQIGQQFAVQVALLVGQAATDLAAALDGALAYDPAQFDALRTIVGYDTKSPDFAALHTILGFDLESDKFRALGTVLGMAPEVSAQVAALLGGIGFASDAAAQAAALTAGIAFADVAREQIALIAAGLSLTDTTGAQVDGLNAGVAWAAGVAAQVQALNTGVAWAPGAVDQVAGLLAGLQLTDGAAAQVDGLNAGVAWAADVAAQVQALNTGVAWAPGAADQVAGLLAGLQLTDGAAAQVDGLLAGLQLAAADRVTVQQLLGGIGFDADTATALHDGLGLRAGLLPTLGTALGLSDEAAKAIGVLSGMGTIDQTVSNAYASIGRVGIGSAPNQIDQQGWDFWRGKLATGELTLASFEQAFLQSAATTAREQQGSALSDYVSPYLKKLGLPGFAVGTSAVPFDMVAQIHQGEEITPRPYVDAQAADRREANRLLAQMVKTNADIKTEMAALKAELSAIKGNTKDAGRVLSGIEAGVVKVTTKAS